MLLDTMDISSIILASSSRSLFRKLDLILLLNGDKLLRKCLTSLLSVVCIVIPSMYIVATQVRHEQCFCFLYQFTSIGQSFSNLHLNLVF